MTTTDAPTDLLTIAVIGAWLANFAAPLGNRDATLDIEFSGGGAANLAPFVRTNVTLNAGGALVSMVPAEPAVVMVEAA